jgi:hypothetical protein
MANEIDLVVGSVAFKQITDLLVELGKVDGEIKKIGESAIKMNTALDVKNTADLTKLSAENAKLNKEIEKLIGSAAVLETKLANLATAQARTAKATTDAAIAEEKLITATNKNTVAVEKKTKATLEETIAQREATAQTTLKIKAGQEEAKTYAQLDAQHKIAVKNAQDLAVQTGRSGKAYEDAKLKANEYGKQLRVIDTDIGKHTRNVGNYSSSWNGLGNSINQLTREAPAFANSVQTGFMALSNNIPILTDELGVLIQKNKDLQKEGKPTQSILKTVAGAFFSWQTAISLGVTILTVYGSKLVDMALGLADVKRETDRLIASQAKLDKSVTDVTATILHNAKLQIDKAKLRNASQKEQDDILLNANKQVLKQLEIAENTSAEKKYQAAKKYRDAIANESGIVINQYSSREDKIRKQKEQDDIAALKKLGKVTDEQFKILEEAHIKRKNDVIKQGYVISELTSSQQVSQHEANKKNNKKLDKLEDEKAKLEKERIENQFKGEIADLETKKNTAKNRLDLFKGEVKDKIALSMNLASKEIDLAEKVYQYKLFLAGKDKGLESAAASEKSTAIQNSFKENIERTGKFYSDFFKKADDSMPKNLFGDKYKMTDQQKADLKEHEDAEKERKDKLLQYQKEIESYLNSFGAEFASKAGLSETFNMLSGNIAGFGDKANVTFVAVAEAAQEMFNIIAEASAANYDAEYARLDKQKTEAIKNAGDSTAAKEKIEADYDKKKKEIQLREFKAKQKITIANIAIDTAQAIVSTYAQVPKYDYGVSATTLAFIIAGLGAAQIAMVATQKPPAYAEGTDNHSGGLMLVNDGAGSNFQEKVILPSGKVIRPQGRNVLMDAPKGTKVLNHEQQLFEMLQSNNISMASPQYQGMTPDEMDEILGKHFGNIKTQNTIFDKNGFQTYVRNGNSITRSNSNRSQAIGISV